MAEYTAAELLRWMPNQLKILLTDLGLDSSGCVDKTDIVDKIAQHSGGLTAAAASAIARGETRDDQFYGSNPNPGRGRESMSNNQGPLDVSIIANMGGGIPPEGMAGSGSATPQDFGGERGEGDFGQMGGTKPDGSPQPTEQEDRSLMGMTLADYMNRQAPTATEETRPVNRPDQTRRGVVNTGRNSRNGRKDGRRTPSVQSGSSGGGRPGTASGKPVNPKNVRLAPSHIAPPSTPAPEWVVEMQVRTSTRKRWDSIFLLL